MLVSTSLFDFNYLFFRLFGRDAFGIGVRWTHVDYAFVQLLVERFAFVQVTQNAGYLPPLPRHWFGAPWGGVLD